MASRFREESTQVVVDLPSSRAACVTNLRMKMSGISQVVTEDISSTAIKISRVPSRLRDQDPEAYEPKIVSIGPFHRNKDKLFLMEEEKLDHIRKTVEELDNKLDSLVDSVYRRLDEARNYYSENIGLLDSEFAEMLVVDGCFIICILWRPPQFLSAEDFSLLLQDLILPENQIPFFVLEALFQLLIPASKCPSLVSLVPNIVTFHIAQLISFTLKIAPRPAEVPKTQNVRHLQHLVYLAFFSRPANTRTKPIPHWQRMIFSLKSVFCERRPSRDAARDDDYPDRFRHERHCATELVEAGLKFKRKKTSAWKLDLSISFEDGTLEISPLFVSDSTNAKLRNLIAFEQCSKVHSFFTSYCVFLNNLIETPNDVAVLRRSEILGSNVFSDAEIAKMISGLCKNLNWTEDRGCNREVYKDLNVFSKLPHHRWRANLVQTYFSNPWKTMSVIAAALLLILTGVATCFTVFPRK